MTRFLKLVRSQNGSWQALPTEIDDLSPVSVLKKDNAPIDPVQLLKALAPLLSADGGINGIEKAPQFASLMKKFSKKLVSRCVYCNVLKATSTDILARFLEEGGWTTINMWLNDAKENSNQYFLLELLQLCKVLPMTLERLKENNTPKVVKALTKYENSEIKILSNELVGKWMVIIKGEEDPPVVEVVRKKRKPSKEIDKMDKEQKDPKKMLKIKDIPLRSKKEIKKASPKVEAIVMPRIPKKPSAKTAESPKNFKENSRVRDVVRPTRGEKRTSSDKIVKSEIYEDVKIKVEAEPMPKKSKVDRPKTVKSYQAKSRATGLLETIPPPKKIPKKSATIDKTAAAVAAKNATAKRLSTPSNERIMEKKIKPESLMTVDEIPSTNGGIKLIPAKPRPTHVLHESASFIDALVATPTVAPKKKKKPAAKPAPTTPPSPTLKAPNLQFYKDTLEMNSEEKEKEEVDVKTENDDKEPSPKENSPEEGKSDEASLDDATVSIEESINKKIKDESNVEDVKMEDDRPVDENGLRSILSYGRRKDKKKNVKWVEDSDLKQIFYFELDETERVNVLRNRSFGDLKSMDSKREREVIEAAKRHAGDKMEEAIAWWIVPIYIDVPPILVNPGCYSQEKEIQHVRQQSVLQEIYFTKEMVPDSPHEPDAEVSVPCEPKVIPLDEENAVGALLDYSAQEIPKPKAVLPEALSSLLNLTSTRNLSQTLLGQQLPMDMNSVPSSTSPTSPYDPGEPVALTLLGGPPPPGVPPMFNVQPPPRMDAENMNPANWGPMDRPMAIPSEQYFPGYPMNPNMMMEQMPPIPPPSGGENMRMRMPMYRPNMQRGAPYPMNRPSGPRRRTVLCRHFQMGSCRFGPNCSFLHPGVNGPPL